MRGKKNSPERRYSYADYLKWDDQKRYEIIDGLVYNMNAPLRVHQEVLLAAVRRLADFFDDRPCSVFIAPFDVRLATGKCSEDLVFNVVQPDISVVCDEAKLDEKGCIGAPDLIVEVISPATASRDHIQKRRLYESTGVREYWLIDPTNRIVTLYFADSDGNFRAPVTLGETDLLVSETFAGLKIDLSAIFPARPQTLSEPAPPAFE